MARRDAPRLAAARRIAEAERAVHQAVVEAIQRWLAAVRSAVLNGGLTAAGEEPPPDMSGWSAADAIWLASIAELITPELERWFGEAFLAVARVATISDQPFREAHIEQVASRLRLFPAEQFEEIRPEIAEAVSEGESIDQVRDRISAVLNFDETAGSGGEQAATRRLQARITEVERLLEDPRTPPEDMADLRAERSRLYPELYRTQNRWAWKARRIARTECLPAHTVITGAEITAAYRRWYSGPWIEITTESGHKLAGTPNHPVLTLAGWKGLGHVTEADYLVCDGRDVEAPRAALDMDVQHRPTTIGEVFDALAAVVVRERARGGEPDFHGDGCESDVDILRPDRPLTVGRFTPVDELAVKDILAPSDARNLIFHAESYRVRETLRAAQRVRLIAGADLSADAFEGPPYRALVDAVLDSEVTQESATLVRGDDLIEGEVSAGLYAGAAVVESDAASGRQVTRDARLADRGTDHLGTSAEFAGDALDRVPGTVQLDRVCSIRVGEWSGHVYNLTTVEGYFAANSIYTGNTVGALNGGSFAGATARAEETGDVLYKEWLATDDVRTREEHREADGQVRPMAAPFLVGGFPLQFPGDPTGPGHLTINCRCTTLFLDEDELTDEQLDQLTNPEPGISAAGGTMADEETLPTGWRGVMGPLDVPTGDGRILATPPDGVRFREGTLPIMWQRETGMGHDGSVIAARVDRAWVEEVSGRSVVMGEGPFDLGGEDGREAARLLREGFLTGLSIDPDEVTVEWVLQDRQGQRVDPAGMDEDEVWDGLESGELTEVMVMTDWRLMGATMTPFPAFDEARITPIYDYEPAPGAMAASGEPFTGRVSEVVTPHPAEHYADPQLDRLTPLTVTDDGRVVGHIAGFSECHLSYGEDVCVTAPRSPSGYAYFHLGEVRLDTGDTLAVGKLTLGGGHADPSLGYRAAIEHYDDVATAIAAVRAGEDAYGVWVSGHLLAGVTPEQVERFMLCPPSGDWRRIGGQLELVAACSVNVPGFPNVRAASGQAGQLSLVAAGARQVRRAARRPRPSATVDTRRLAAEVARELRAMDRRTARAQEIAARIGR